ncbi:MAG: hypothetical protein RL375_3915 [Pseudomonadota bacterium]
MRLALLIAATVFCLGQAQAFDLVTGDEAAQPEVTNELVLRGITRGPLISVLQPDPQNAVLKSPFKMLVSFKALGGSRIDARSVEVLYLKEPLIDLTPRLASAITDQGLALDGVVLPPGMHRMLVRVADQDGRSSDLVLKLKVDQ